MKKGLGIVGLCFVLIIGALLPEGKVMAAIGTVTINTNSVNIRQGPGLTYPLVTQTDKGDKFPYVAEEGDWIQLQLPNGKTGWIANWLISKSNTPPFSKISSKEYSLAFANTNKLRIRTGPGTNFQIIGYLNKGQKATILDGNENWIKISSSFGSGWVSNQFLDIQSAQSSPTASSTNPEVKTGTVVGDNVNVRTEPALSGSIVGKLSKGMTLTIYSTKSDWLEIHFSNKKAWVSSKFISIGTNNYKSAASAYSTEMVGTVTASGIRVRNGASLGAGVIGTINKGQKFTILKEANNWDKIEYKTGSFGWVAGWYLDKSYTYTTSSTGQTVKESTVTILQNGSNIRKKPTLDSDVLLRANASDKFSIINGINEWYEIKLKDGTTGFVAGWIVSISGSAPQIEKPGAENYLKNKIIVVDPGHGGQDDGTTGFRGTFEKDLTLRTAKLLYDKLRASGANVIITRNNDTFVSLPSRVSTANFQQADAFVSLHYDSINDRSVRGMTGYYYYAYQKPLAQYLYTSALNQTKLKDRGLRFGDFHVIRENSQKAALLELGYLSNPEEELTLTSGLFQENVATGIYDGLARYFKDN